MNLKKITQSILIFLSIAILIYTYYYLPSQNLGFIKVENSKKTDILINENNKKSNQNFKNTFFNTEYKSQDNKGQVFTIKAKESFFYQDNPELINLIYPYSYTKLEKDKSLIEINSNTGLFDKEKKITTYNENVIIKNKNYMITANKATHFSKKNIIIIEDNVIMKDFTSGLSHIAYCDIAEINTITNDALIYMKSKNKKVITKKYK